MTVATITCPFCDHKSKEEIPKARCLHSYICKKCKKLLEAKPPDCCVFCSFADRKCEVAAAAE